MKNKFAIISIIVVVLLILLFTKVYHLVVVNHVFDAIEKFKNEENRAYSVETIMNGNVVFKEEKLLKQEIMKYIKKTNDIVINCKWKNFVENEEYFIDIIHKEVTLYNVMNEDKNGLFNLSSFIEYSSNNGRFNLSKIFDIYYIIPIKYKNKPCYKIVTKNEVTIIDKDTYLPFYSSVKRSKLNEESKGTIEKIYEFKVGEVTDEDIALPDLSEYTVIE